ncbi:MAG: hypothetical protein ABIJ50_11585 [Pseudomonadota bacterium]
MSLLDAIDKLLEPITKKIFATKFGKSINLLSGEELTERKRSCPNYEGLPGNIWYPSNDD